MYKTKILGTTVVCGTAGWFYGRDQRTSNASIPNLSQYVKYTQALQAQGYVPIDQAKPFFQMHRQHMFTHAILSGHNRLNSETHMQNPRTGEIVSLFHIGSEVSSTDQFPTVCTTLFDECLAKAAFQNLPNKIGVTGTLEIDPIKQFPAGGDGYIAVHARPTASKGRKAEAEGYIKVISSGEKIATARVIMIEPSWAKYLSYFA